MSSTHLHSLLALKAVGWRTLIDSLTQNPKHLYEICTRRFGPCDLHSRMKLINVPSLQVSCKQSGVGAHFLANAWSNHCPTYLHFLKHPVRGKSLKVVSPFLNDLVRHKSLKVKPPSPFETYQFRTPESNNFIGFALICGQKQVCLLSLRIKIRDIQSPFRNILSLLQISLKSKLMTIRHN